MRGAVLFFVEWWYCGRGGGRIGKGIGINIFLKFDIGSIGAFLVAFIWILYLYFSKIWRRDKVEKTICQT